MNNLIYNIDNFLTIAGDFLWGYPLIILLMGTHIFLTIRLKFIQKYTFKGIKLSVAKDSEGKGDVTPFGAITTALASTIGTGNIVGVATAVASGGPGAVLWMWFTGVFGIATKYAEALLAVKYRVVNEKGEFSGGPMYVCELGLKSKLLGVLFASFAAFSALGSGNMTQANSLSLMLYHNLNVSPWITGIIIAILTALVIIGGIKSIAKFSEILVPFMAAFYVLGCLIILMINSDMLLKTIELILTSAFSGHAIVGGFIGATVKDAMRYGIARGLFSNESGQGSAPILAAAANTKNPVRQALVSSTGTFWDTVVICAITGLVIVSSMEWIKGYSGGQLTSITFEKIPLLGPIILTVGLITFAFSTIIGWEYYGEKSFEYLFGVKYAIIYRVIWVIAVFIGSVVPLNFVWKLSDVTNALMALPNLISLILLHNVIYETTNKYLWSGNIEQVGN